MTNNETGRLYRPAAICSLGSYVPLIIFYLTKDPAFAITTLSVWGAGLALWAQNGRRGGFTPWPTNRQEAKELREAAAQLFNNANLRS